MDMKIDFHEKDIAQLDIGLLTEGLNALRTLAWVVEGDIYTDAPEYQASVNQAQDALQGAYDVLERISLALLSVQQAHDVVRAEALAWRILDEAEEAFAARSMAEERAQLGKCSPPGTVSDYLFWIEDEASLQEALAEDRPPDGPDRQIYVRALHGLADELRDLGFTSSPALQEFERQAVQA